MSSRNRIAIVNSDKCKPNKCQQECKKGCPVVRQGKLCIQVNKASKIATISEDLCTGCGICTKKCPFKAIRIINLPRPLTTNTTHRYGENTFRLHGLPVPRRGQVLGLVGINGIGKLAEEKLTSAMKPQYVDHIPKGQQIVVGEYLDQKKKGGYEWLKDELELTHLLDRKMEELSGGELQRFAIAATAVKDVDIYMFDESSSFLDIKQRLKAL